MNITAKHQGFRSAVSSRIRALLESLEARCLLSVADDGLPADDYSASMDAVAYEMPLHGAVPDSGGPESGGIVQGDINADGRVDGDDYYNLDLAFHGQEAGQIPEGSPLAAADLNADGRVDAVDYFLLDSQFVQLLLGAPAAPSALAAEPLSTNEIALTWADNSPNETAFTVERRQAGLSEWAPVITLPADTTTHIDELLLSGTEYHYRVCASNANGHSAHAILASATTLGTPPLNAVTEPAAPASLTASAAGPASVFLQWQDRSDNEDAFVIVRQLADSGVWQFVATVNANATSHTDAGLADAASYIYGIAARNFAGVSAFTAASAVSLPALPPGNVAAVAVSSSQINLAWTDNSANETGYAIERKTGPAGAWGLIATVAANTTSYQSTGLTPATPYLYRVRANSPAGNSGYSAEAAVTTLALSLPAAPTTLTATAASTSQVNLAWTDNAINETGYVIQRKTGPAGTWTQVATVGANVTSYASTGLSAATQYFFRVRAVNADGNSSNSAEVGVTTLADVPAAPSALVATAISPEQINLVWVDNASNETAFAIERKVGPAGTWSLIATVGANVTSYQHTGLSASTQYFYRVRAANAAGNSAYTADASATTPASLPAAPDGLTALAAGVNGVQIQWNDRSANEDGFVLERRVDAGEWLALVTLPANATSYLNSNLTDALTYSYRVAASNSEGLSAVTSAASVALPLAAPTHLVAEAASSSQVNLSWTDHSASESGYAIERKTGEAGEWTPVATVGVNVTSYQNASLSASTQYAYRVRAASPAGSSGYSAEAGVTTFAADSPTAPAALSASPFSAARIDLNWTDSSDNEDGYIIEQSADGASFAPVATLPADTTSYSVTSLQPDTEYFYRVRATNGAGAAISALISTMTLMNATLDGDGWTTIVPSADTRIVYVSSSEGDDGNTGLSADSPVKTLLKGFSLLRNGMPDHLRLKRGDTFEGWLGNQYGTWDKGGRAADQFLLVSNYGDGARPVVRTTGTAFNSISATLGQNVAIVGIEFYAYKRDPNSPDFDVAAATSATARVGINWLAGSNLLIEDCYIRNYETNIVVQRYSGDITNVSIRRNVVVDAYSASGSHSQGAFVSKVDGLLMEGNVFDHNGWNESVAGGEATVFNHNVYMAVGSTDVVIRDNTFANASSHGLQARSGGQIAGNLFVRNPIHLVVGNGDIPVPGGVLARIEGNVFFGSGTINGAPRGFGVGIQNLDPNGQSTLSNNLFVGDSESVGYAIKLAPSSVDQPNVGINNLTISGNVVYGWAKNLEIASSLVPGGTGRYALNNVLVRDNHFQAVRDTLIIDHGPASLAQSIFTGNKYDAATSQATWFRVAGTSLALEAWQRDMEVTGVAAAVSYPDPSRDIASYDTSIGGAGTTGAFVASAREQSRTSWHLKYTALSAIAYLRGGFAVISETT